MWDQILFPGPWICTGPRRNPAQLWYKSMGSKKNDSVSDQVGSVPWEILLHVFYVITLGCVPHTVDFEELFASNLEGYVTKFAPIKP